MHSILEHLDTISRECKQFDIQSVTGKTVVFRVNGRPQTFVWREGYAYRQVAQNSPRLSKETYHALLNVAEHLMRAAFAGYRKNQTPKKTARRESWQMHLPI